MFKILKRFLNVKIIFYFFKKSQKINIYISNIISDRYKK